MFLILLACAPVILQAPSPTPTLVSEVANLQFHSAFWVNLHHTLYGAAWAKRPVSGSERRGVEPLPAPLNANMVPEERAAWDAAIDYYDREVASRDLRTGRGMTGIKLALADENLSSDAIETGLRETLERAAPVYRRHFWPAHDAANRAWIKDTADRFRTIAPEMTRSLERLYGNWFTSPVRIDVVWVGRAYTTIGPTHSTISPAEKVLTGWTSVEIALHEASHDLILPTEKMLADALGDRLREHGVLWHVVQFYVTGAAMNQVLRARGIDYTPYMYSTGLFDRAWSRYKAVAQYWDPYVRGEITRDEAIARTVAAVTAR